MSEVEVLAEAKSNIAEVAVGGDVSMDLTPTLSIELAIYDFVRGLQLQHGLKYDDFRQYRSYLSRRIHRIRRSLNVRQGVAPSAKARHQRARKLINISNTMVLEAGEKEPEYAERTLIIPLCLAERSWSYAMQLKQEVSECPRRRFHLVRRLEKAAIHASRFEKLCHDPEGPCSERTKKEAAAYSAYMNGIFKMERENWAGAKEDLQKCLHLYTALSLSIERVEQYRLRIEELKASLRYCTFTLGEKPKEYKNKLPTILQFHDIAFKHARQVQQLEQELKQAPAVTTAGDEDGEDEFEETRESMDEEEGHKSKGNEQTRESVDEEETEESESDDDDDDDDKQQQTRSAGVTGLVKGWLGGAWS